MSNLGSMLIRTGAMIVGSYFGGPIGAIAAYAAASALFPMTFKGERPQFSDYPLQSSTKGQPVPILFGTKELAGNVIWLGPEDPYYVKHESGGKGGGDTSTSYEARYRRSFLIAICEGPAYIRKCWKGKEEISLADFTVFSGDGNTGLAALVGDDWTDYKNVCCAYFEDYELGNSPALPNFVFEVSTDVQQWSTTVIPSGDYAYVVDADYAVLRTHNMLPNGGCWASDIATDGRYAVTQKVLAAGDNPVIVFDRYGVDQNITFEHSLTGLSNFHAVRFSDDGSKIYAVHSSKYIYVWNSTTGELLNHITNAGTNLFTLEVDAMGNIYVPQAYDLGVSRTTAGWYDSDGVFAGYWGYYPGAWLNSIYEMFLDRTLGVMLFACLSDSGTNYHSIFACTVPSLLNPSPGPSEFKSCPWGAGGSDSAVQVIGDGEFIYAYGSKSNGYTLRKYDSDLNELAGYDTTAITGGIAFHDMLITKTGQLQLIFTNAFTHSILVFSKDLELIEDITTTVMFSSDYVSTSSLVPRPYLFTPPSDAYPPDIIRLLLTEPRKGIGLPESLLNLDTFNDELDYCMENDIKMSLALTEQRPLADWLQYICTHFLGYLYESNGKICLGSMRPADPVFAITQDDLVREGQSPPVKIKPRDYSETCNRIEAVWSDRDNRYRETPVPAFDEVDQRISGFLRHKTVDLKGLHDPDLAAKMAWLNFINAMYRFKTYSFTVGYKHLALEVGDVGTLDDGHRVSGQTVRITSISLAKDGKNIQIEAVEDITALYPSLSNYTAQQSLREPTPAVTLASGSVAFRESTTEGKLLLSIAPGGAQTNGWYIYRSYDNISYDLVGRATIDGVTGGDANSAGTLQSNLAAHTAVVHRKDEAFDVSIGTVTDLATAVTDEAFFNNRKLARIGDEIIAYRDCVESATEGTWRVANLIRGLFGTSPAAHLAGETFQTLDTDFTYALTDSDIGKTLYFKVVSFYGSKVQSVSEVSAASIQVQGLAARPLPASLPRLQADENDIAAAEYSGSSFELYWNLPGTKSTGFNQGGFDLNETYPVWRYGDPESELIGGSGAPYGHFLADAELQGIDLVFEETDGTHIGQRSIGPTADSETISVADDLDGNADAVIKIYPRRSYRSAEPAQLQVTGV